MPEAHTRAHERAHTHTAWEQLASAGSRFQLFLQTSPSWLQTDGLMGVAGVMATDPTGPSKRQTAGTFFLFSFSANQLTQKSPPRCQVWALAVLREVGLPPPPAMPKPTWQDPPRFCFILSTYGWSAFCLLCCLHRSCPHTRERCLPVGSTNCPELRLKQVGAQQLFVKGMKQSQKRVSEKQL